MTTLRETLDDFQAELQRVSPLETARLAPGVPLEVTARRLQELGLAPCQDILDWFAWHNGGPRPAEAFIWRGTAEQVPLPPRQPSGVRIGPGWFVSDLDFLADQYEWYLAHVRANLPQHVAWETGWFPLMGDDDGYAVAYGLGDSAEPVRVAHHSWEEGFREGTPAHTLTLQECMSLWTETIRSGQWTCDESDHPIVRWTRHTDWDTVPLELKLTGLAP